MEGDGNVAIEDADLKARLPRGIDAIREHIAEVDDVPLLVSLFANASPHRTKEMVVSVCCFLLMIILPLWGTFTGSLFLTTGQIALLQENLEVVTVIGSSLNWANGGYGFNS